jgi:hypothetical protein
MWALLYDDGTSLTTVSEPIAHTLAEAERQRGREVTVRYLDDDQMPGPGPVSEPRPVPATEPAPALEPAPAPEPAPASEPAAVAEPGSAAEPARESGPARAARPAGRRRLVPYALAAAGIVVAAALAAHWNALPALGATTSSSSTPVSGPSQHPQLLPPLEQPPVMHFSNTARGG